MNVMIGCCTTSNGENWPIYVDAEREAFYARRIKRVSMGACSTAGSLCEPPSTAALFEPECQPEAFLIAAPTDMFEAVPQCREALGTVGSAFEVPRRDGPIFERFSSAPNLISFRGPEAANEGGVG